MSNLELQQISMLMQPNYSLVAETEHKAQGAEVRASCLTS